MTITGLLALLGLAVVDSTSVGTLVLPVLMLLHPRVSTRQVLVYLATISGFYLALGAALLVGSSSLLDLTDRLGSSPVVDWVQLIVGAGMLLGSFWPDTPWARRAREASESDDGPGRAGRWLDRMSGSTGMGAVVVVALLAGLVEAASMLPYLGAIALLSTSDLPMVGRLLVLTAYVVVMATPTLILLLVRRWASARLDPWLARHADRLTRGTGAALWWALGILGFLLAADALGRLT